MSELKKKKKKREKKKKKKGDERVTGVRERGIDKVRTNKIRFFFFFTILLQCNSTFRIAL